MMRGETERQVRQAIWTGIVQTIQQSVEPFEVDREIGLATAWLSLVDRALDEVIIARQVDERLAEFERRIAATEAELERVRLQDER